MLHHHSFRLFVLAGEQHEGVLLGPAEGIALVESFLLGEGEDGVVELALGLCHNLAVFVDQGLRSVVLELVRLQLGLLGGRPQGLRHCLAFVDLLDALKADLAETTYLLLAGNHPFLHLLFLRGATLALVVIGSLVLVCFYVLKEVIFFLFGQILIL